MVRIDRTLDARQLICPMPVIRTQQTVADMEAGQILKVQCTDPGALFDIPAWCRVHGHEVVLTQTQGDESTVHLRIKRSNTPESDA